MTKNIFPVSLSVSFGIHCAMIVSLSIAPIRQSVRKIKPIEVTYLEIKEKNQKLQPSRQLSDLKLVKPAQSSQKIKVVSKKMNHVPFFEKDIKDMSRLPHRAKWSQKLTPKLSIQEGKLNITVPLFEGEKITNPKYLSYNQTIREKIKQRAYTYIHDPEFKSGEVYLSFGVGSDGGLTQIKVNESKTFANEYLRSIGLRSIQESTPFPPFPHDLNYPELTFNIVISFQVEE